MTAASEDGVPDHVVVRATDPELFQCQFVLVEDGGGAHFSDHNSDIPHGWEREAADPDCPRRC